MKFNQPFWINKKVFITGHTGFKGTWLSIILNFLGANIYGYSLKPKKKSLFNQTKIKQSLTSNTYGDIKNISLLKKKLKKIKPSIIFHLAAQPLVIDSYKNPKNTFETNIIGTVNLLESIREIKSIKSVVIITTDKVYKIKKKNINYKEVDNLGGDDPYSASKASTEIVVNSYIKSFLNDKKDVFISTARSGNVIGGGDYSKNRLLPDIISSLKAKKKLIIRSPGSVRPWQHVLEPLLGYLILAEKQFNNKISKNENCWNFGPKKRNFKKVIQIVKEIKKIYDIRFVIRKNKKFKETKILKLNSTKSEKKLKWVSKMNLIESLKLVTDWFEMVSQKVSPKEVCEKQFLMYIEDK